jgi:hypothetical protein
VKSRLIAKPEIISPFKTNRWMSGWKEGMEVGKGGEITVVLFLRRRYISWNNLLEKSLASVMKSRLQYLNFCSISGETMVRGLKVKEKLLE